MKVYRAVMYVTAPFMPDHQPPVTMVMRDRDMTVPPEEAMQNTPGALVIHDIFEMDRAPAAMASFEAGKRSLERRRDEDNMATMYFWNAASLMRVNENGVLANEKPAPLDAEQIRQVFAQLVEHPNYRNQTILATSARDGRFVRVVDGRVVVDYTPGGD